MALTGLDIFKLLPKTNCGECGAPTCLAFAMKLAQGQAELASCPTVSDEAKAALSAAAAPPQRGVTIGSGDAAFTVGEETVLFRHDKTFVHPAAIGATVDSGDATAVAATIAAAKTADYERVQQRLNCRFVAVRSTGDADAFVAAARAVVDAGLAVILLAEDPAHASAALDAIGTARPLLHAATEANADAMIELAKKHSVPLAVRAKGLEAVSALTEKAAAAGLTDLVIDSAPSTAGEALRDHVFARRAALNQKFAPLGYPVISFPGEVSGGDVMLETVYAAADLAKYANIIALSTADAASLLPLLVLGQNIYTDPQRPMQAEAKVYEIGSPGPDSPFIVTTNFSLTYFIVSSEIEGAKAPAYLGVVDAEGLSVLTAWAAGKFVPERIAKFVKESGIAEKISEREVIIPGAVAQISGELAEELDGWKITVGPYEAADLPAFVKRRAS
jgi:acetyl-CoA decarbonylase/synthase, CODH/ACS complex subunit gamma